MKPLGPLIALIFMGFSVAADEAELWSFQPLDPGEPPEVKDVDWPKTRVDSFVLARLEREGLEPAPPADSRRLLRRLHFVLTGLPPTPEEAARFSPADVGEKIEELLGSPHYGERWARHWLDLARYTDTTAGWLNSTASAWHYRDWVVDALNSDMPYDDFVRRQLATDLIGGTPPEDNAALGFLGLSPTYWKELKLPPEIIRKTVADEWEERIDAFGRTFLGLTLACARCHDHKSDPVSMADYYAIAGVFASVRLGDRPMMDETLWAPVKVAREKVAGLEKQLKDLNKKRGQIDDYENRAAILQGQIDELKKTPHYEMATANGVLEAALFVKDKGDQQGTILDYQPGMTRDLAIQRRGDPNNPGEVIERRFLSAFPGPGGEPRRFLKGSGRLELADAMLQDARALVARVMVNRVWQHHFGRGIVETPSDFGREGSPPSHPALLDDLSSRFIANGWSLKWLHREILGSATWQQSSVAAEASRRDPENRHFARMSLRRLDVESLRDSILFVSGTLDPGLGGLPRDLDSKGNVRRTLYGKIHRRDLNSVLRVHDFPDPTAHGASRIETTTPLQVLFALNSSFVMDQSEKLARRIRSHPDPVGALYRILFQREPSPQERELGEQFTRREGDAGVWSRYVQAVLGSNEFVFVD